MKLDEFWNFILPILPVTKKTKENYSGAYRRNISKPLGNMEVRDISKNQMLAVLDPLKPQNQMQTLMVMRVIWREAVNRGEAEENPAKSIKCPKIHVKPQKFLTWEEIKEIDFGRQTKRIRFLALHGLRYGEAAALTKDDIHDGMVHINKSKYGPTKTPSGIRSVPLLSEFEPFPTVQVAIAHALRPYGVTVHSLRKTYAYTLKKSQIHITTAARMMGHSNPMITLKIYTQVPIASCEPFDN